MARMGVINLIPKPRKDTKNLDNQRPITLCNSDYKVFERMVADKIQPALEHVINCDQRGFMKGRRIATNIRLIYELIRLADVEKRDMIILSLDFMKCFDRIEFSALIGALQYFGFAENIINWTKILYTEFKVNTQNNGNFSRRIDVGRGLHQGGPCSSLYFLIIAEIMAIMMREDENICGITINDLRNILGQYADDADIYSLYNQKSLDTIFQILERFRSMSGFQLNYNKTTIMRIGSLKDSEACLITQRKVSWTNEPINVLGVTVTNKELEIADINYASIVTKVKNTIDTWKSRSTSLLGKVLIINTLVSSLFVYKLTVIPGLPDQVIKELNGIFNKYFWNGARPKIKIDILSLSKQQAGLGLTDLQLRSMALKISWIQILRQDVKLANIVYYNLGNTIKELIWKCNLLPEDVKIFVKDIFWLEVFEAWFTYVRIKRNNEARYSEKEIIWLNSNIRIEGKPILWSKQLDAGLIYISQLFRNGKLRSAIELNNLYKIDIMQLNSLISAIPQEWRRAYK